MRQAGFLTMCARLVAGAILAGGLALAGSGCCNPPFWCCQRNPCAPATVLPSTVQAAPVCDVPTEVVEGGTKLSGGSSRSTTVSGGQTTSSKVVVSEPANSSRFPWRRSEDSSLASTTVQGTTNDAAVNR
jgi:hypothetical protein